MALASVFLSTLLLAFGISLSVAGFFGAYFGRGRSRSVGFVIALTALLVLGLFAALTWPLVPGLAPMFDPLIVGQSMVAVAAASLGFAMAIVSFVVVVMRA